MNYKKLYTIITLVALVYSGGYAMDQAPLAITESANQFIDKANKYLQIDTNDELSITSKKNQRSLSASHLQAFLLNQNNAPFTEALKAKANNKVSAVQNFGPNDIGKWVDNTNIEVTQALKNAAYQLYLPTQSTNVICAEGFKIIETFGRSNPEIMKQDLLVVLPILKRSYNAKADLSQAQISQSPAELKKVDEIIYGNDWKNRIGEIEKLLKVACEAKEKPITPILKQKSIEEQVAEIKTASEPTKNKIKNLIQLFEAHKKNDPRLHTKSAVKQNVLKSWLDDEQKIRDAYNELRLQPKETISTQETLPQDFFQSSIETTTSNDFLEEISASRIFGELSQQEGAPTTKSAYDDFEQACDYLEKNLPLLLNNQTQDELSVLKANLLTAIDTMNFYTYEHDLKLRYKTDDKDLMSSERIYVLYLIMNGITESAFSEDVIPYWQKQINLIKELTKKFKQSEAQLTTASIGTSSFNLEESRIAFEKLDEEYKKENEKSQAEQDIPQQSIIIDKLSAKNNLDTAEQAYFKNMFAEDVLKSYQKALEDYQLTLDKESDEFREIDEKINSTRIKLKSLQRNKNLQSRKKVLHPRKKRTKNLLGLQSDETGKSIASLKAIAEVKSPGKAKLPEHSQASASDQSAPQKSLLQSVKQYFEVQEQKINNEKKRIEELINQNGISILFNKESKNIYNNIPSITSYAYLENLGEKVSLTDKEKQKVNLILSELKKDLLKTKAMSADKIVDAKRDLHYITDRLQTLYLTNQQPPWTTTMRTAAYNFMNNAWKNVTSTLGNIWNWFTSLRFGG